MAGQIQIANGVMQVNGVGGHGIFPPHNLLKSRDFVFEFQVRLLDAKALWERFFRSKMPTFIIPLPYMATAVRGT